MNAPDDPDLTQNSKEVAKALDEFLDHLSRLVADGLNTDCTPPPEIDQVEPEA